MRKILIFFILVSCAPTKHDYVPIHHYGPSGVTFYKSEYKFDVNSKKKVESKLRGGNKISVTEKLKYMEQAMRWCAKLRKPDTVLVENSNYIESYKCQK